MERFRIYDPNQQVMMILNPSNNFGEDSFEVFLVNIINTLDTSHFWPNEDRGGETPYDPRAMLGIILYGFCRGTFSSRKLERACLTDIGFIYVSGHNTPDHAAICRFLKCWRIQLKEIFAQIVYLAYEKGFIDYKCLSIDGTKIKANASKAFTGTLADFRKRLSSIELSIEESMSRLESNETNIEKTQQKIDKKIKDKKRITDFLCESDKILNRQGKEKKQNITDPDCRLMLFSNGTVHEAYNAQACVDGANGLIVAPEVSQEENDRRLLTPVLSKVISPEKAKDDKWQILADSGYWDPNELANAEGKHYELFIPSQTHASPLSSKGNTKKWEMKNFEKDETGVYGIVLVDNDSEQEIKFELILMEIKVDLTMFFISGKI
ncbi:MAG: transposase [Spirochaetales bacterium]|nr:transposase [Spirochaetales bacterium]